VKVIPRTKVNYGFRQLLRAAFICEKGGAHLKRLRQLLGAYFGVKNVLLTASGRCGLYYILRALPQSRVIIPAYTCNAVTEAAILAGKHVIYVDAEADAFNMDLDQLRVVVNADSIVVATHQFGIPCDINQIVKLCHERGAVVVEDAAASLGTRVSGRLTGTFGAAAFFSFDSTKLINVPLKGGFVLVKDEALFDRIASMHLREVQTMPCLTKGRLMFLGTILRLIENRFLYDVFHWLSFRRRGAFTAETSHIAGTLTAFYRFGLANWQAYIAAEQISKIESIIAARQTMYAEYRKKMSDCAGFLLPPEDLDREWACIRFPIRVKGNKIVFYHEAVKKGVDFAFSFTYILSPKDFARAHALAGSVLDVPFYHKLRPGEMQHVTNVLQEMSCVRFRNEN
jgi:dTDP-4-amino-4,6-dideoxygalactose transaminase